MFKRIPNCLKEFLKENGKITVNDVRNTFNLSRRKAIRYIKILKKALKLKERTKEKNQIWLSDFVNITEKKPEQKPKYIYIR